MAKKDEIVNRFKSAKPKKNQDARGSRISPHELRMIKFSDAYMKIGNAKDAAIMAGYSEASAEAAAFRLLANPYVINYIQDQRKKIEKSVQYTFEEWFHEMKSLLEVNLIDFFEFDFENGSREIKIKDPSTLPVHFQRSVKKIRYSKKDDVFEIELVHSPLNILREIGSAMGYYNLDHRQTQNFIGTSTNSVQNTFVQINMNKTDNVAKEKIVDSFVKAGTMKFENRQEDGSD
jgi:hypothetical protein